MDVCSHSPISQECAQFNDRNEVRTGSDCDRDSIGDLNDASVEDPFAIAPGADFRLSGDIRDFDIE